MSNKSNIEASYYYSKPHPNIQMVPSEDIKQEKSNTIDGFNRKQSEASTVSSLTLFEEVDDRSRYFSNHYTDGDGGIFNKDGKVLGCDIDNCLKTSITTPSNQVTDLDEETSSNATTTNQAVTNLPIDVDDLEDRIMYVSIVYNIFLYIFNM